MIAFWCLLQVLIVSTKATSEIPNNSHANRTAFSTSELQDHAGGGLPPALRGVARDADDVSLSMDDAESSLTFGKFRGSVSDMTIQERADAADYYFDELKKASEALSKMSYEDFPELEKLRLAALDELDSIYKLFQDSIRFVRLAATEAEDKKDKLSDTWSEPKEIKENYNVNLQDKSKRVGGNLPGKDERVTVRDSRRASAQVDDGKPKVHRRNEGRTTPRRTTPRRRTQKRQEWWSDIDDEADFDFDGLFRLDNWNDYVNPIPSSYYSRFSKNRLRSMVGTRTVARQLHTSFYPDSGSRRRLTTKNDKCMLLAECASRMSIYDLIVLFHSDDIDPSSGQLDSNLIRFYDGDLVTKQSTVKQLAAGITGGDFDQCDNLLAEFHRTVEFDAVPQWEGATISQVCLAEGTTVFVDLASAAVALQGGIEMPVLTGRLINAIAEAYGSPCANSHLVACPLGRGTCDANSWGVLNEESHHVVCCAGPGVSDDTIFSEGIGVTAILPSNSQDERCDGLRVVIGSDGVCPTANYEDGLDLCKSMHPSLDYCSNTEVGFARCVSVSGCSSGVWTRTCLQDPVDHGIPSDERDPIRGEVEDFLRDEVFPQVTAKFDVLVESLAQETFVCAQNLFDSDDRKGNPQHENDEYIFEKSDDGSSFRIPTGVVIDGTGRTIHGQIEGDGIRAFSYTDSVRLREEYEFCREEAARSLLDDHYLPTVDALVEEIVGFRDQLDPERAFEILGDNDLALGEVEEIWCHNGVLNADTNICCSSRCGVDCYYYPPNKCGSNECCTNVIEGNGRFCKDPSDTICIVPSDKTISMLALKEAIELYMEDVEECASDYFDTISHGLGLVFGERTSSGYICGVANAVAGGGKSLPGSCCLDAPFQLDGENWGFNYDCSTPCQNVAPYLAGISEETCAVYGGTFCPSPTDCSVLQSCISDLKTAASESGGSQQAFEIYLRAAPEIKEPTDSEQCGMTREYFGFEPDFINDIQICDDIEQFRFSRDFTFLEEFFGQGTPAETEAPEPPPDVEPVDVPPLMLIPPSTEASTTEAAMRGQAWRATNFALRESLEILQEHLEVLTAECPIFMAKGWMKKKVLYISFIKRDKCVKKKKALHGKILLATKVARRAVAISEFTYGEAAEVGNVEPIEVHERTEFIYDNMQSTADYMQERFMDLKVEIAAIRNAINVIPAGTRRDLLDDGSNGKVAMPEANQRHQLSNENIHRMQIEIASLNPKSFVCSLVGHKDAGVMPEILDIKALDVATSSKIPVKMYDLVDLSEGSLMVKIPESVASTVFFVTVGLNGSSDQLVAEHSLTVSFPLTSYDWSFELHFLMLLIGVYGVYLFVGFRCNSRLD